MKQLFAFVFALSCAAPLIHGADGVDLQIDRSADRFNVGLPPFSAASAPIAKDFRQIIIDDLNFSSLFNLVLEGPAVERAKDVQGWVKIGPQSVFGADLRLKGDRIELVAHLYDVASGKELIEVKKKGGQSEIRTLAHETANEIVKYFTGQAGIFTSKIAFVNDATGRKELYLADYDGKSIRRLTNDNSIVILPRIAKDGQRLVFTSYRAGNPDLYIMNRDGSGRTKLSAKAGLNVSPSWSPNGQEMAVTLSLHGPPNIYLLDLQGNIKKRLTETQGADTAPSFSSDGSQLVFTSDRSGSPHIFIMNLDGTGVRRLTTTGHCDSAAWSPDGQTIVYVKGGGGRGHFDIYSIEVLTGIERRLTWGSGDSENPTWSPDSRFIAFTTNRRGKYELFVMQANGSDQKPLIQLKGQSFTPHWSN
jgi:TolB protein